MQAAFESDTSCINVDEDELFRLYASQTNEDMIYFYHDYVDVIKQKAIALCKLTRYQNTRCWRAERQVPRIFAVMLIQHVVLVCTASSYYCLQVRITASSAYPLYTYIKTPKSESQWQKKLEKIIVRQWGGNKHTEFGKAKEEFTKKLYGRDHILLSYVGLIVPPEYPWFGFSPDGFTIVNNELILLEIKSLKVGKKYVGVRFLKRVKFLNCRDGEFVMKKKHLYYAQIQLGLAFCNLQRAKLLLYVHKNESIIEIDVPLDVQFVNELVPTLDKVYFEKYLPFLCENKIELLKVTK
jgi:hypothetical protein